MKIQYFKATKRTNRFRENQIVWISFMHANHLEIKFNWRGSGRMVNGIVDKFASCVGEIKEMEIDKKFYKRIVKEV